MTDTKPTPAELVTRWRAEAARIADREAWPSASQALRTCADELEAALKPSPSMFVAELTRIMDEGPGRNGDPCDCGHSMSGHSSAGCIVRAEFGMVMDFCLCVRKTVDDESCNPIRWDN